jgi:hypothetical protein
MHEGPVVEYLGMLLNYSVKGEVSIVMPKHELDVITSLGVTGTASTPATENLFKIDETLPLLSNEKMMEFHSHVMKILFLAKRTRVDLITANTFLVTRVGKATEEDWEKLMRVGRYLNGTKRMGIRYSFHFGSVIELFASIDASFAIHQDGKSQSAIVICVGNGPVFVRCHKQKIVTKSSHEAELVSASDGGSQVIWSRDFVIGQGYDLPPTVIYQDNMGTIASIKKGKAASTASRHVHVRYFWMKDRIDSGEINVEYMPTDEMIADMLTKPLQGEKFRMLRAKLMNWHS